MPTTGSTLPSKTFHIIRQNFSIEDSRGFMIYLADLPGMLFIAVMIGK
jgi:hypothetical protein